MEIQNVTVAGGGILGSQIAFQAAYIGYNVVVYDIAPETVKPRLGQWCDCYLMAMEKMKTDPASFCGGFAKSRDIALEQVNELEQNVHNAYDNIVVSSDLKECVSDADLLVEAVVEDVEVKKQFYREAAGLLPERTLIASNSSTYIPSMFAEATGRPEKFIAMHYSNHIWKMNVTEIMHHPGTAPETIDTAVSFAESLHMIPIRLNKEQPGYIMNSLLIPLMYAGISLYANGVADAETIDKTWRLATGAPYGPLMMTDAIGMGTTYNIIKPYQKASDDDGTLEKVLGLLSGYMAEGKTGMDAGEGFHRYH